MSYNEPPNYGAPPPPPPGGGGQPPYGGQPYGGQPYGGGQPQQNSVMAIIGLVLGILGLIPCLWGCFIFSIAAVVLGFLGKKETDSGQKKGGGMALAALITGVLGILASILIWILFATGAFDFYYNDI